MNDYLSNLNESARRKFLKQTGAALGLAGLAGFSKVSTGFGAEAWPGSPHAFVGKQEVILFQGDSITDAGRDRSKSALANDQAALGNGYACMAGLALLLDRPEDEIKVYNMGVSGNKVFELADRWRIDCLNFSPTLLSILIGVNDFWHTLTGKYAGTLAIYERDYRALVQRTRESLPKTKLIICEPFALRCGAVDESWFPAFDSYRSAAKRVADSFDLTFIPFQAMFDEALKYAPPAYWAADGVHPTPAGAALMAHTWLRIVAARRFP